jgi:hypothetical protein
MPGSVSMMNFGRFAIFGNLNCQLSRPCWKYFRTKTNILNNNYCVNWCYVDFNWIQRTEQFSLLTEIIFVDTLNTNKKIEWMKHAQKSTGRKRHLFQDNLKTTFYLWNKKVKEILFLA